MGNRAKSIETSIAILWAFYEQPTWKQADLARRVNVTPETIKNYLEAMVKQDLFPLEKQDDPPDVFWSVPRGTFAGGLLLSREDLGELIRLLMRSPASEGRDRLMRRLIQSAPDSSRALPATWDASGLDEQEEEMLSAIEDSITHRRATDIRYFSSSRGQFEWRAVSFQKVLHGLPVRTCAFCHRTDALRWFRLDGVADLRATQEDYRARSLEDVDAFLAASVDGFHDGTTPQEQRFFVRDPEARWVRRNLMPPMEVLPVDGGIEVLVRSAALMRIARFVVSLGGAARPLTPELAARVLELAEGARENATAVKPTI